MTMTNGLDAQKRVYAVWARFYDRIYQGLLARAQREAVAAGLGIGVVPSREFGYDDRVQAVAFADGNLATVEALVYLAGHETLRPVRAFLDLVHEEPADAPTGRRRPRRSR